MKRKYGGGGGRRVRRRTARRMRRYRRKYTRGHRGLARAIKSVVLRTAETKSRSVVVTDHNIYHNGGGGSDLVSDPLYLWNQGQAAAWPTAGTGERERAGNEIYLTGFRVRLEFEVPNDRRDVKLRLFLVKWNDDQGPPWTKSNWFKDMSSTSASSPSGNVMLDPLSGYYNIKKLYDGILMNNSTQHSSTWSQNNTATTRFLTYWFPCKRKLMFDDDTNSAPKKGLPYENCAIIPVMYHNYSTLTTDIVGVIGRSVVTMYYKDP